MRGYLISVLSFVGLCSFCILMLFSNSLVFFWLFLELGTLCVIPAFFLGCGSDQLGGLFNYIVVSSISSSLILCGFIGEGLMIFLVLGFLIKFGIFPFLGWVYNVVLNSNWFVVWALSTFLKVPVFLLPFFLSCGGFSVVSLFVCLTLLVLSLIFWFYSYSWFHCWCHMMLSSSAVLVAMSFCIQTNLLFYLFFVYCFWASLVIFFLSFSGSSDGMFLAGVGYYFIFCVLLVSTPVSISIFYKLIMSVGVFSCSFMVICCWVLYSLSEQFYLLKYAVSCVLPKFFIGMWSFV